MPARIFLTGNFNGWQDHPDYELKRNGSGSWELLLPLSTIHHGDLYALSLHWHGGSGKRIPAWARRVVQDPVTHIFNAQVWEPKETFHFRHNFKPLHEAPLIYESHVGMAGEEPRVHTYNEFRYEMLPRIKAGRVQYDSIDGDPGASLLWQFWLPRLQFFCPLIEVRNTRGIETLDRRSAHGMGIAVVMDLVHSHAVKNVNEGLGLYDGTRTQFFHDGARGEHPAWDSYCFNYG